MSPNDTGGLGGGGLKVSKKCHVLFEWPLKPYSASTLFAVFWLYVSTTNYEGYFWTTFELTTFDTYLQSGYMSGGSGYVLSRETLRRFATIGIPDETGKQIVTSLMDKIQVDF